MSIGKWLLRWRERGRRKWFVIGDLSPFRGSVMLITGPLTWRHAKRECRHWLGAHPFGRAAIVTASEEVASLKRWILCDYD